MAQGADSTTMLSTRWTGTPGYGIRHTNDPMDFSLWDPTHRTFRGATLEEGREICRRFDAESVGFYGSLMVLEVASPPEPVPLTVACMPAIFKPVGQGMNAVPDILGTTGYVNPRGGDACPELGIQRYVSPTTDQMIGALRVLSKLMNICEITFLPSSILVQLVADDGREYGMRSLPAYASSMNLVYYHRTNPYHQSTQDSARRFLIDPRGYIDGPRSDKLSQNETHYVNDVNGEWLTPGMRISTRPPGRDEHANAAQASSCGVRVRSGTKLLVTASHQSFLAGNDVYCHASDDGEQIGEVVDRYPELDIVLVQLTPAHADRFSNQSFRAETPRRLAAASEFATGTWFEMGTTSTGRVPLHDVGTRLTAPARPPGHPTVPFEQWRREPVCRIFRAMSSDMLPRMCGAPVVEVCTGKVAGFFRLAGGDESWCIAGAEDLIAKGMELA